MTPFICISIWIVLSTATNAATDTNPEIPSVPGSEPGDGPKPTNATLPEEDIDNDLHPDTDKIPRIIPRPVPTRMTPTEMQPRRNDSITPARDTPARGSGIPHRPPPPDYPPYYYVPVPGPPGMPGPTGTTGNPGYPGPQGPMGYAGPPGNNGNNGSPGLVGRPGVDGQKGEHGVTGLQGGPGIPGSPGVIGDHGQTGSKGQVGQMGPIGRPGVVGREGPSGPKGFPGTTGKPGPPGFRGLPGNCDCTQAMTYQRAFSVARTTSLTATNGHMIITWNHEFSNVGGDFDMSNGIFNVTVAGTYFFTIHVYKSSRQNFPLVQLMKNGEHIIGVIDYGPNDSEDSSGNSVVLSLSKGDAVWLVLYDGKEIYSSHYKFTTFSGFLIFPNLE